MSDIFSVTTRATGADMEFVGKSSGNIPFALRAGDVVDMSAAASLLHPPGHLNTAAITLTAAQIKALHATPITLVAAQGAGTFVDVTSILYDFIYGTVQLATSTGVINLYWGSGGTAIGTNGIASALVKGTASLLVGDVPAFPANTSGVAVASALNKAVVVQNPSATEYATGDSTMIVRINYRIITGLS